MTDKDIRQQLAEFERLFSAGYDSRGCIGLNPPYSWESCARVALDLAHAVANGVESIEAKMVETPKPETVIETDDQSTQRHSVGFGAKRRTDSNVLNIKGLP